MSTRTGLTRRVLGLIGAAGRPHPARAARIERPHRLLEPLEGRQLLALVTWDGGGDGTSWEDPANWSGDALPTAADDVEIDVPASPTIVHSTGTTEILSLNCAETLQVTGGNLTIGAASAINGDFTLADAAALTISAGTTTVATGAIDGDVTLAAGAHLTLTGDVAHNGAQYLGSGQVHFTGGTHTFEGNNRFDSQGRVENASVTVLVATGTSAIFSGNNFRLMAGLMQLDGNFAVAGFSAVTISGGAVDGVGNVTVVAHLNWSGGSIRGSGILKIQPSGTLNVSGNVQLKRNLTNDGAINWTAGNFWLSGATVTTLATRLFIAAGTGTLVNGPGTNAVNNSGTFRPASAGTVVVGVPFNLNDGSVNIVSGAVRFAGPINLAGGAIIGPGTAHIVSSAVWTGSGMDGAGVTVFHPTSTLSLENADDSRGISRRINIHGTVNHSQGGFLMDGATIAIMPGATYNLSVVGAAFSLRAGATATLSNAGTLNRTGAQQTTIAGVRFSNTGTLNVTGVLNFTGPVSQIYANTLHAGSWNIAPNSGILGTGVIRRNLATVRLNGVNAIFNSMSTLNSNEGILSLGGKVTLALTPAGGTFANAGTLILGVGTHLSVTGAFAQTSAGTFITRVLSTATAGYGRLTSTGAATLDGTFTATIQPGYVAAVGHMFTVIDPSTVSGTFATENLPSLGAGKAFDVEYLTTAVRLVVLPA